MITENAKTEDELGAQREFDQREEERLSVLRREINEELAKKSKVEKGPRRLTFEPPSKEDVKRQEEEKRERGRKILAEKDPYEILEVSTNSPDEEIKKAYRVLAMEYHTDRNPGDKEAERVFKHLADAYSEIETAEKREAYKRKLLEPILGPLQEELRKANDELIEVNKGIAPLEGVVAIPEALQKKRDSLVQKISEITARIDAVKSGTVSQKPEQKPAPEPKQPAPEKKGTVQSQNVEELKKVLQSVKNMLSGGLSGEGKKKMEARQASLEALIGNLEQGAVPQQTGPATLY